MNNPLTRAQITSLSKKEFLADNDTINLYDWLQQALGILGVDTPSASPVSVGGSNTQIQYNNAGVFAGSSALTFAAGKLTTTADATINTVVIGKGAGNIASNMIIGQGNFSGNTTGTGNVIVGANNKIVGSSGNNNIILGTTALILSTSSNNVAIGQGCLGTNTTGGDNVAIGYQAGGSHSNTGSKNIFIGYSANGLGSTIGDNGTYIGSDSTVLCWLGGSLVLGTSKAPNARAIAMFSSTSKGFLPPVMSTIQRDAVAWVSGDKGMLLFNSTTNKHQGWDGTTWNDLY